MKTVMIATPSHDCRVGVEYAYAASEAGKEGLRSGINVCPVYFPGESILPFARNELLAIAVSMDVDELVWIDSDMVWEPSDLFRLLTHEVDVVGFPCPRKSDAEAYNVKAKLERLHAGENGLIPVDAVGTGFLRMSRRAVRALWEASTPYRTANGERRMAFELGIVDGEAASEDNIVCRKLVALGFPVHIDPATTIAHAGRKTFRGDFPDFVRRLKVVVDQKVKA